MDTRTTWRRPAEVGLLVKTAISNLLLINRRKVDVLTLLQPNICLFPGRLGTQAMLVTLDLALDPQVRTLSTLTLNSCSTDF